MFSKTVVLLLVILLQVLEAMASVQSIPSLPAEKSPPANESGVNTGPIAIANQTLDEPNAIPPIELGSPVALLPVELDVLVPVRKFRVRNLLALEQGQIIETQWGHGEDVPLSAGQVQLAWSEFEVIDSQLGVRVTRLA